MQKNVKISKIDKKRNKLLKNNKFLLLGKCLKVKEHKILRHQTNVYAPTFM